MPDQDGNLKAAEATHTPLHAYKDGREEDVEGDPSPNPQQQATQARDDESSDHSPAPVREPIREGVPAAAEQARSPRGAPTAGGSETAA